MLLLRCAVAVRPTQPLSACGDAASALDGNNNGTGTQMMPMMMPARAVLFWKPARRELTYATMLRIRPIEAAAGHGQDQSDEPEGFARIGGSPTAGVADKTVATAAVPGCRWAADRAATVADSGNWGTFWSASRVVARRSSRLGRSDRRGAGW